MWLKRVYDQSKIIKDESGQVIDVKPGAVLGVRVLRAKKIQHFSQGFLDGGLFEGWLSIGDGKVTIKNLEGDPVIYQILRVPNHYCCFCEKPLPEANRILSDKTTEGMRHIKKAHKGKASPDPNNPAGYRRENHYTCLLMTDEVESLSQEECQVMEIEVREALHRKIKEKILAAQAKAKEKVGG